ncbi:PIN domain-containing protein [Nakamurella lactea]|uniref:NYN domain-containing protein n=1 Tax=Nakamurella lactea TaxID=459515 RepID=UPI00048B26EF|nr:NYN domain-containing protein [Nakamurella lactea]
MGASDALRTAVIMDYQNVHLTGHGLFSSAKFRPRHECLIDPLLFANCLLDQRNQRQRPGFPPATLSRVLVYRGQPSSEHDPDGYARNQAQKAQWERDPRVRVTLRPLKYLYSRDQSGRHATDTNGQKIVVGPPREKGVDVLCALACVREAQAEDIDLVILASSDSDLAPALDEVRHLGTAKIETCCWYDRAARVGYQLHPTDRSRPMWNTQLDETTFKRTWDMTTYS